jgi:hypothetical protein
LWNRVGNVLKIIFAMPRKAKSSITMKRFQFFEYFLAFLISIPFVGVIALTVLEPWQWSYLMDDIGHKAWMPQSRDLFESFFRELNMYWALGRFTPTKYFFTLVRWRFLPLDPWVFHIFNLFWLLLSILPICLILKQQFPIKKKSWFFFVLPILSLPLAKPVLEVITFITIPESFVIFFFAWGLYFLDKCPWLARIFLILSAGAKEPASFVFFCLAMDSFLFRRWNKFVIVDAILFLAFLWAAIEAMQAGPYLANYHLFTFSTLLSVGKSVAKLSFFMWPLLLCTLWCSILGRKEQLSAFLDASKGRLSRLCLVYFLCYVTLVGPRGNAGYLLIPPAFALFTFLWFQLANVWERLQKGTAMATFVFAFFIMGCFNISLWRDLNRGINEPSAFLRKTIDANEQALILVNGVEAADQSRDDAKHKQSRTQIMNWSDVGISQAIEFSGAIYVLELTRYMGAIDATELERIHVGRNQSFEQVGSRWAKIYFFPDKNKD